MADTTASNLTETTNTNNSLISRASSAISDFRRYLGEPAVQRAFPTTLAIVGTFVGILLFILMREPSKTTLFASLPESEKSRVIEVLRQNSIDVSLDTSTGEVLVPTNDYYQSRMLLAGHGLPASLPEGYDSLKEMPMGTSRSVEAMRIKQTQELELARSVNEISGILGARVHLALPEKTVFIRERSAPTASVFVKLAAGRSLGNNTVQAIVHLVSSSVPNLPSENVTVVDQQGNLLSRRADDPTAALTERQLEYSMKLEQIYRQRIISILTPIHGAGNVTAQVSVDVDFTRSSVTEEVLDPEGSAVRSEQASQDQSMEPEAVGVPGSLANTPPLAADLTTDAPTPAGDPAKLSQSSSSSIRNYELSRKVSTTQNPTGEIKRIAAAVLVRDFAIINEAGERVIEGLSDEERARIESLVREAIGISEARGDTVNVSSGEFLDEMDVISVPWYENSSIRELLGKLFTVLILGIVTFGVLRPLLSRIFVPAGIGVGAPSIAADDAEMDELDLDQVEVGEGESLEDIKAKLKPKKTAISAEMLDTANTYDDKVAVIRMIVGDEAGRVSNVFKTMMSQEVDSV